MHKVSVIIPVYNVEKYIDRCARSLFNQTLDSIEYIFIDDCSSDKSMSILQSVIDEFPDRKDDIVIIRHRVNTGQSGARRDGMVVADGEYLIHCDADDWVEPQMYESMYNKAVEENLEAVCCDIAMEYTDRTRVLRVNGLHDDHKLMYDCLAPISVEYLSMCNRMISRKVFERTTIEPFEGVNMWDDVGLSIRLRYHIKGTAAINKVFYHYNRLNNESTTRRPLMDRIKEQTLCIEYLEDFFHKQQDYEKYSKFISYLKIHSIEELFRKDATAWLKAFRSERKNLWSIRHLYKTHILVKYYTVGYGGPLGKLIWKIFWKR